jgi:hypothetical protein
MNKNNLISRDDYIYLEGAEQTIVHIGDLLNVMTNEIKGHFDKRVKND